MSSDHGVQETKCRACRHETSGYEQDEPDAQDLPAFQLRPKDFKGKIVHTGAILEMLHTSTVFKNVNVGIFASLLTYIIVS